MVNIQPKNQRNTINSLPFGISINEDPTAFISEKNEKPITKELCQARMDLYDTRSIKEIFLCPINMRLSLNSNITEPFWHEIELPEEYANFRYLVKNMKYCYDHGINPCLIWLERIRQNGQSPWLSMRMNDVHSVHDENNPLHSVFWKQNPHLRRAPYRAELTGQALDYGRKEVRERSLQIIKENLDFYSPDGLELDWMRFPDHFRPGFESDGRKQLNEFLRQIKKLTEKKGIQLGVRVPARPHDAFRMGFDVYTWSEEKLVDRLVATPFWASSDYDLPIEEWKRVLHKDILLCAGIEILSRTSENQNFFSNTDEIIFGYAANFLARGADRLYFFNHMASHTGMHSKTQFNNVMNNAGDIESIKKQNRRHVITYTDTRPVGIKHDNVLPVTLPPEIFTAFRIPTGLPPEQNQNCELILGFPEKNDFNGNLRIWINAQEISSITPKIRKKDVPEDVSLLLSWNINNALLNGYDNVIELYNRNEDKKITINWCELYYHA